jgi:hypothetical protein
VANGLPRRLDFHSAQVAALGRALLPQIAEALGRAIVSYERERYGYTVEVDRRGQLRFEVDE